MTDHVHWLCRAAGAVILLTTTLGANAAQHPDFTGMWKWNATLSDDPMEKLVAARDKGGFGGESILNFLRAAESITISTAGGVLVIRDSERRTIREMTIQRKGMRLVSNGALPQGVRYRTIFELTTNGDQLVITHHLEFPRSPSPIVVRYVYDHLRPEPPGRSADLPFGPARRAE